MTILFITWENISIVSLAWFEGSSVFQSHQLEGTATGKQATALLNRGIISHAASKEPRVGSNTVIMKHRDTRVLQFPVSSSTESGRYSSTQPNAKRQTALLNATGFKHVLKSLADFISTIPE